MSGWLKATGIINIEIDFHKIQKEAIVFASFFGSTTILMGINLMNQQSQKLSVPATFLTIPIQLFH